MKPWRVWLVYGIVGALTLGHLMEIARQTEHWPFSNYPMWARVTRDWNVRVADPVGVTAANPSVEVKLTAPEYFAPMPVYYQRLNLERAARRKRDDMLRDYLARYERRREAGEHAGPPLRGIRVYENAWLMDRNASNVQTPERRTLLYEYQAPAATKGAGQ